MIEHIRQTQNTDFASLSALIGQSIAQHLRSLDGETPEDLYALFLTQLEKPLLERVLIYAHGNQSKAAKMLGLNRGTLRTKLKQYDLL